MSTDPVALVLSRLKGVKKSGRDQWEARCPAHDDRSPSLSIGRGSEGQALLTDHAGCTLGAITAALGMELRDLFPRAEEPPRAPAVVPRRKNDIAAVYPYHDEEGRTLFEVVRFANPKDFRQRKNEHEWSVKGVRRVLYRLPEVSTAVQEGRAVFVVEGEKDADRLAGLELAATCNAGGAKKWADELSEPLRGARVVIVPDNDAPGKDHAELVVEKLKGIAAEIRVLELPGLGPVREKHGEDVSDWLDAGHTVDELKELVRATEPVALEEATEAEAHDKLPKVVRALDAPTPEPPQWRVRRFATKGDLCVVASDGGVGKSTMVLALAGAVTDGSPAFDRLGFQVEQGPVLYVSEEDPPAVIINRLEALIVGHGWDRERVLGNFYFFAMEGASLDSAEWRAHLLATAQEIGAALIIFDPYAELTASPENDNDKAKQLVHYMRGLGQQTGAVVVVVHHLGKMGEGKRKIDRIRGASALYSAARMVYALDLCEAGIAVECLKMTKAEKLPPFVLTREVDTAPNNPAEWVLARVRYMAQRQAEENGAEAFIRKTLETRGRLNTSELKKAAKGSGNSGAAISKAISEMKKRGEINFEDGPKGSKMWGLVLVASLPEFAGQPEDAGCQLARGCPATKNSTGEPPALLAPSLEGQASRRAAAGRATDRAKASGDWEPL